MATSLGEKGGALGRANGGADKELRTALSRLVETATLPPAPTSDSAQAYSIVQEALQGRSPAKILSLNKLLIEQCGRHHLDLAHFVRAHLSGESLDVAQELLCGFDPNRAAAAAFEASVQAKRKPETHADCAARMISVLSGGNGIERTPIQLTQLILAFETPYNRSLFAESSALLPNLRDTHPLTHERLARQSSPQARSAPDALTSPAQSLLFAGFDEMSPSTRTRLYVLGQGASNNPARSACEQLIRTQRFGALESGEKEIAIEVLLSLLPPVYRHYVNLIDSDAGEALFKTSPPDHKASIDFLHELCFGPLCPDVITRRREVVSLAVLALVRGEERSPGLRGLPFVPNTAMELALSYGDFKQYLRMFRELVGPDRDTWYRRASGPVQWFAHTGRPVQEQIGGAD